MMRLVPVPTTDEHLSRLFPHWYPFLEKISRRSKESVEDLLAQVARKDVQPILIWDEQAERAVALIGMRYAKRGEELLAEWVWLTGRDRKAWQQLLPELEKYLKEHVGCVAVRPLCRPGWSRILKPAGYRVTHYQMEKKL